MQNFVLQLHHQYSNYCITFKGLSPNTLKGEYYCVKQFVETLGINHLAEIEKGMVEHYITERKLKKNWSVATIRNTIQSLQSFLN